MATIHDLAAYIIGRSGNELDTWSLHKLVYYSQAWSLVWDGKPIVSERIEAWRDGPVLPALFDETRASFTVYASDFPDGNPSALSENEVATVEGVLEFYGRLDGRSLGQLTHRESPWIDARGGLHPRAHSKTEITADAMRRFYGQVKTTGKRLPDGLRAGIDILLSVPEDKVASLFTRTNQTVDEIFAP